MKKILFVSAVFLCICLAEARAPLESYKRYMIVLVHGVGAKTLSPHDYTADAQEYEDLEITRKSAIWDSTPDDMDDKNWQGNIGGNLQARGFLGHVVWYDFYEPWRSPIYDSKRSGFEESLSRYLGDRNIKEFTEKKDSLLKNDTIHDSEGRRYLKNPMSYMFYDYWKIEKNANYEYLPTIAYSEQEAFDYCTRNCLAEGGYGCSTSAKNECLKNINVETQYFGRTAQTYWLHEFFLKYLKIKF